MKKYVLSFAAITVLGMAYSLTNNQGNLYSSGSGAPSAGSCAVSGCHGGSTQTSEHVTLTILDAGQNAVSSFNPGETYTVVIEAGPELTNTKFGFALSATTGTLSESSAQMQVGSGGYLTHTAAGTAADAGGGKTWTGSWQAPATATEASFRLYLNATNADNSTSGDVIYMRNVVLNKASGIAEIMKEGSFSVYPVPASDLVNIDFELKEASEVAVNVTSHDGKLVKTIATGRMSTGKHHLELSDELASGLYFVTITANTQQVTKKMVIR